MAAEWHYSNDGQEHGPVSASVLKNLAKSGALLPSDLIWKEGMAEWTPAGKVKGLFVSPAEVAGPKGLPTSPLSKAVEDPIAKSVAQLGIRNGDQKSSSTTKSKSWITRNWLVIAIGITTLVVMFQFLFVKRGNDAETSRPIPGNAPLGQSNANAPNKLTEEFFPMPVGPERFFTLRRYSPKKYGKELSQLDIKYEEKTSKWLDLHPADKRQVGAGAMYYVMFDKRQALRTLPGHGTALTYRNTAKGMMRCDSFGTAGGQKPLDYEILELRWGAKPGDKWETTIPEKKCLFSAQYDKHETLFGVDCAVVTISRSNNDHLGSRKRYWLAKGIGIVRYAEYGLVENSWRPEVERIYSELKSDIAPLDWESK